MTRKLGKHTSQDGLIMTNSDFSCPHLPDFPSLEFTTVAQLVLH